MAKNRKKGKSRDEEEPAEAKGKDNVNINVSDKGKQPKGQAPAATAARPKPKSAAEKRKDQIDGIVKTVYPSVLGILAGFACYYAPAATLNQLPWHFVLLVVLAVTYFVQKVTYPLLKIDVASFKGKDWFYVEFMAIDLWLVSWTLLLN